MKKFLFVLFIVVIAVIAVAGKRFIPSYLYKRELESEILSFSRGILKGKNILLEKEDHSVYNWKKFHFSNFLLPLPIRHPSFRLTPFIHYKKRPSLGMEFADPKKRILLNFKTGSHVQFASPLHKKKIFLFRFFREYMEKKMRGEIIEDLFSKNLLEIESQKTSHEELIYNLFILEMRKNLFPSDIETVQYLPQSQIGILSFSSSEKNRESELWYAFTGSGFETFFLQWRKNNILAQSFRERIMRVFRYKKSNHDMSKDLYKTYKSLPYKRKIDQEGLIYLLSAWSHDPGKTEYVREMIFFMEKGEKNFSILLPLYKYYRRSLKQKRTNLPKQGLK